MLPFDVEIRTGGSVQEQVVHAIERALVSGQLRPGDKFPSVRTLSKELRINPNTAHKIVSTLIDSGALEVRPGIGTLVAEDPASRDPRRRDDLLGPRLERLVVEAARLGLSLDELESAIERQWRRLTPARPSDEEDPGT